MIINIHGIDDLHQGVSKSAWSQLSRSNAQLEVTINLLHTENSPSHDLRALILDSDLPITHFRSYFVGGDTMICDLVNLMISRHNETLRSLVLVQNINFKQSTLSPSSTFSSFRENPLVMLAWRCKKLEHLTIIGKFFSSFIIFF